MYTRSKKYPELFKPGAGSIWWAFIPNPHGGRQLRETTGHRDELAAHAWFLERVRRPDSPKDQKDRRLVDALDDRIEWLKLARASNDPTRKKLAEDTIDFYVKKSRHVARVLGDVSLKQIGHEQIRRYITVRSKETAKATTISKELTALSMAWRLARKDGVALPDFSDIVPEDFAAQYVPKTRWLTEAEVERFVEVLNPKRVGVFLALVSTGATYPSELSPLRPADIMGHVVHIKGTKATTRDRYVPVPSYGRKFLRRWLAVLPPSGFEPWTNIRGDLHDAARLLSMCEKHRDQRLAWARHEVGATKPEDARECAACKATPGVLPCSPNDLRRTFAQWLVRSGVPYELAAAMMGHGSTKMLQQVYGRRDVSSIGALVELALKQAPKNARTG